MKRQTKKRHSATVLAMCAVVLVVGGRLYQIVRHPEWTEAQALRLLWPLWLAVILLVLCAFVVDRLTPDVASGDAA